MGIALADAAASAGADVTLVLGPAGIAPANASVKVISVVTAAEMYEATVKEFADCDVAILAAAVADYTPAESSTSKLKKKTEELSLKLLPTADIAARLGKMKNPKQLLVGFALETNDEIENAKAKLRRKNLDLIVLNSLRDEGSGFGYDTNKITVMDRNNNIDKFELKSKDEAARDIIEKIVSYTGRKKKQ